MPNPFEPQGESDRMIVEIRTTVAERTAADTLARRLVDERLAACVQVDGPVTSTYRWQNAIETATEWRCTCKTTSSRAAACAAAIRGLHPYETPEIIETRASASDAYAAWVHDAVTEPR